MHSDGMTCTWNRSKGVPSEKTVKTITLDRIFSSGSSQKDVYDYSAKPIVDSVLKGFNGTIFAYGQTGSGKTHTMMGSDIASAKDQGIIPRMVRNVFSRIETADEKIAFYVKVAFIEIYMEKVADLLEPKSTNLTIRFDKKRGVTIDQVTERQIASEEEVYELIEIGNSNRKVATTKMNPNSSRSHGVFIITIEQENMVDKGRKIG
jgi:kinesin family protein 5